MKQCEPRKLKVAFANNYITPYRIPLYETLAAFPLWDLMVYVSTDMEFDRQWELRHDWLFKSRRNFNLSYKRRVIHTSPIRYEDVRQVHLPIGLLYDLWRFEPDMVISAEMGMRSLLAALYCAVFRKPLILWYYQTQWTEKNIDWKKRIIRQVLVRSARAFVGMGTEARLYLQGLGAEPSKIFDAPNSMDLSLFQFRSSETERLRTRQELGVRGLTYLFSGRMIPTKGGSLLLKAWEVFSRSRAGEATLLMVGGGVEEASLREQVARMGLKDVVFAGFFQTEELPRIYAAADVFVFTTLEDVWGLVVNESLAMGLPVICSRYAGCAGDLIEEGKNGWLVDPLDHEDLVLKLQKAWEAREQIPAMSLDAGRSIAGVTIERMAEGFRAAVEYVRRES